MVHCKKCGAKIKDNMIYCAPCQHDIDNAVSLLARQRHAQSIGAKDSLFFFNRHLFM